LILPFTAYFLTLFFIDIITFPRFIYYAKSHDRFIESIMLANPELDPDLIEEQYIADMNDLAMRTNRKFRTFYCELHSNTKHIGGGVSDASYDEEFFEFQIFIQPPPVGNRIKKTL